MKQISQGAEAKIFRSKDSILKDRFRKGYRIKEIDHNLRQFRTRREAKVLDKLQGLDFPGPSLIKKNDKEMKIEMSFIKGPKVRDVLEENHQKLAKEIGQKLAKLHKNNIIHGDLTTSNMILDDEINFIDFGLSFFSHKVEDKAVDLHLLDRALESKHHTIYPQVFDTVLESYKEYHPQPEKVLKRLEKVQGRGRNKNKH